MSVRTVQHQSCGESIGFMILHHYCSITIHIPDLNSIFDFITIYSFLSFVSQNKETKMIRSLLPIILLSTQLFFPIQALPYGFEDREVVKDGVLEVITDMTFLPNGNMIVIQKEQPVSVLEPQPDGNFEPIAEILDLSDQMCVNGERGIHGVELHPNYPSTPWIYLFYTFNLNGPSCLEDPVNGPVNRLSRFNMDPDTYMIDKASEKVFFSTPSLEYDHHNSGDIAFGNDGMLYVSVGDAGATWSKVSNDPSNLLGTILRFTDDGGIPQDNPFTPQSGGGENTVRCHLEGVAPIPNGKCQEIFAIGLRNPFRFAIDPNTHDKVRFYINDVGHAIWEEVNEG